MHEMSIVSGILSIVATELAKHNLNKLSSITVVCGSLSNVVPESLQMAFELQIAETPYPEAQLILEEIPITLVCNACSHTFAPPGKSPFVPCPECGNCTGMTIKTGRELYLKHLEV